MEEVVISPWRIAYQQNVEQMRRDGIPESMINRLLPLCVHAGIAKRECGGLTTMDVDIFAGQIRQLESATVESVKILQGNNNSNHG